MHEVSEMHNSYYKDAGRFTIDAHKYIIWEYDTCRVTQYNRLNHDDQRISYCFDQDHCQFRFIPSLETVLISLWITLGIGAGVVDSVSSRCGHKANAHGGTCYFYDSLHFCGLFDTVPLLDIY